MGLYEEGWVAIPCSVLNALEDNTMNEAKTRTEHIDPALAALKKSLLHQAFSGEL